MKHNFPKKVIIRDCTMRDGWQSLPNFIPTEKKIEIGKKIMNLGTSTMEITSFMRPDVIPQTADAEAVAAALMPLAKERGVELIAMQAGKRGLKRYVDAGFRAFGIDFNGSNEQSLRNMNCTADEWAEKAVQNWLAVKDTIPGAYIGQSTVMCAFGSPFHEEVKVETVAEYCRRAMECDPKEICLADTAGVCSPLHMQEVLEAVLNYVPAEKICLHLHDTRGTAIANTYVALEMGIGIFETCLGGLGGCPVVPGEKGNTATEDVIQLCNDCGIETEYSDLDAVCDLAIEMESVTGVPVCSAAATYRKVMPLKKD